LAGGHAARYNLAVTRALLLLSLSLAACDGWPRYAHLPTAPDTGALPAGTDPGDAVQVTWTDPATATENGSANGLPIDDSAMLSLSTGAIFEGDWQGIGWTDTAPDRAGSCGDLAFPVGDDGSYEGDVDWVGATVDADGYLCATIEIQGDGVRVDLMPFLLDDCGEPTEALVDDAGAVYGYAAAGPTAQWAVPVHQGDQIGVSLAPYWPQDLTMVATWRIGLSLTSAGVCPSLPGAS